MATEALQDSIPFFVGEVNAVDAKGNLELIAHTEHELGRFISTGDNVGTVVGEFIDVYTANRDEAVIFEIDFDPDDSFLRRRKEFLSAIEALKAGTEESRTTIQVVGDGTKTIGVPHDLAPSDAKVGDRIGVWAGKEIITTFEPDKSQSRVGKVAITAVLKLP